jgi:hypothetical protein
MISRLLISRAFKGYREVVIQDIVFETFNTCYRLAQYQTLDGRYVSGQLPDSLNGSHFGNDTGARHNGKNGYCTHPSTKLRAGIDNELFAWFSSTESKSRINFLSSLSQGKAQTYVLNAGALAYMEQQKLPPVAPVTH